MTLAETMAYGAPGSPAEPPFRATRRRYAWLLPPLFGLVGTTIALMLPYRAMGDEDRFIGEALHFMATGEFRTFSTYIAYEMPGTGIFYALLRANLTAIVIANSLMIPLQAWLVYRIGRRAFSERTGLLAGCAWGVWPPMIFFAPHALSEALFTTLFLGMLAAVMKVRAK